MFGSRGGLGSMVPVKAEGVSVGAICQADKVLTDKSMEKVFIDLRRNMEKEKATKRDSSLTVCF